jgi:hypothetical protein
VRRPQESCSAILILLIVEVLFCDRENPTSLNERVHHLYRSEEDAAERGFNRVRNDLTKSSLEDNEDCQHEQGLQDLVNRVFVVGP